MRTYTIREKKEQTYTPEHMENVRQAFSAGHIGERDFATWMTNYAQFRGIESEARVVGAPQVKVVPIGCMACGASQDFKAAVAVEGERTIRTVFLLCSNCGHPISVQTEA